eukprot:CAMPEP_0113507982 /NCGR_PEP_ID=MMETSP0014_2-20120614/36759_1 /TAXON_ID=2857 /ORGANISM="Nitzschia sp." /LENGTH=1682 /DNA_ID=CAMNT_0000403635 /DNA_START=279 /DNA_END=5327 /DNA_ORIENTATION=+ /assembly_acc=CAM_ASM_000159
MTMMSLSPETSALRHGHRYRHRHHHRRRQRRCCLPGDSTTTTRATTTTSTMIMPSLLMFCFLIASGAMVGVVTPFAGADVGINYSSRSSIPTSRHNRNPIQQQQQQQQQQTQTQTSISQLSTQSVSPLTQSSLISPSSMTTTQLASSSVSDVAPPTTSRRKRASQRIRSFLSQLNPMPGKKDGRWKGGESKAKLASRLLFSYVGPLLDVTQNRTLTEGDAFELSPKRTMTYHSVDALTKDYEESKHRAATHQLQQQQKQRERMGGGGIGGMVSKIFPPKGDPIKKSRTVTLTMALIRSQKSTLIFTAIMRLLNTAIQAFPAILLARLLRAVEAGQSQPLQQALKPAFMLVGVLSLKLVVENAYFHSVVNMSTQVRGSVEGLIFDKSLRLPDGGSGVLAKKYTSKNKKEKEALGSGGVLNLMQSDASIIENLFMQVHTIWDGPLQIAMYMTLLFNLLGPSVIPGVCVMLAVIPFNAWILRILDRLSRSEIQARSERTKRTTESITHMKLLKVQAWEKVFGDDVSKHRTDELDHSKTRGFYRAINSAVSNAVPAIVLVVVLTSYAKTGRPILASTVFTAISLFNQLRFPLFFYPAVLDSIATGKNALRRISSYLTSEELVKYVQYVPPTEGGKIEIKHGSFLWSTSQQPKEGEVAPPEVPALCDVNLQVNPGEVVAVVGPVGSGKSALVKGILGELAPVPKILVQQKSGIQNSTQPDELMSRPEVTLHGQIGYCSQDAWLPKGTLRDSIVFGRDFDEELYESVIFDAGLDEDIARGTLRSDTDVGEKGSNLSGGQRARVALARALYGLGDDTRVFLLDDVLAALDARVGSIVFERVVKRLRKSKAATLIVTNDPSLPRRCDRVVLMGPTGSSSSNSTCSTIVDCGTYDQLIRRGHNLRSFPSIGRDEESAGDHGVDSLVFPDEVESSETPKRADTIRVVGGYKVMTNDTDCSCHADPDSVQVDVQNNADLIAERVIRRDQDAMESMEAFEELHVDVADEIRLNDTDAVLPQKTLPEKESNEVGLISTDDKMTSDAVPLSAYFGYLRAVGSPVHIIAMLASFGIVNGAQFYQQFTVSKWTDVAATSTAAAMGGQYLGNLVNAAFVVSFFLFCRSYLTMLVGRRASAFYHNKMLSSVFRAPMKFFDSTPSGQILSRFGKELETVDKSLPETVASVIFCVLQIFSSGAALAGAITPAMIFPLTFAGSLYVRIMRRFRPAARDMKRSEQRSRSPIFTNFAEALRGSEVIRSIPGATTTWSQKHRHLSDKNLAVYSTVKALDRWLSVNLEAIGNLIVFLTASASLVLARGGRLASGSAGWGLTQSLAITGLMAWAVRNLTTLESNMMSVVRVSELTDIDSEEPETKRRSSPDEEAVKPRMPREMEKAGEALKVTFPSGTDLNVAPVNDKALLADGWPWKGGVAFKNVSMRYNEASPVVLKDVNVSILPGSTLGVVGRTGSGKSSMLLTLFRIVEIEKGGSIEIDGVDIRSVSIETLRDNLAIIPQEATLFAGSLAFNLDATGKATPEEMWEALEAASPDLANQFRASGGLDSKISEGGGNLSQGERQLICLARALIRKSKILVLDEATSALDVKTDRLVQAAIKTQFIAKGVSVITVAHRLDTVLGYDNIAVLKDGNIVEYGEPSSLLKIPNGELRALVEADKANKRKGVKRGTPSKSSAVNPTAAIVA